MITVVQFRKPKKKKVQEIEKKVRTVEEYKIQTCIKGELEGFIISDRVSQAKKRSRLKI